MVIQPCSYSCYIPIYGSCPGGYVNLLEMEHLKIPVRYHSPIKRTILGYNTLVNYHNLVGGLEMSGTFFIFPYIGNVIIPTDELIFFRGVGIPPTSNY